MKLFFLDKILTHLHVYIYILDEQRVAGQMNGENGEVTDTIPVCDIIRITGQPENVAAAKQALLDLVPITIEVSFLIKHLCSVKYQIII